MKCPRYYSYLYTYSIFCKIKYDDDNSAIHNHIIEET